MVLVDFWTRECINCQHTLPYVRDWANKYRAAGLVVIGVHTPEYPWERSLPLLRQAVKDWRITYPVVADNEYAIWNASAISTGRRITFSTLADSCVIPHSAKGIMPARSR